jgi:uncharacterized protein with beta-barrel porin domain
MTRNASAASLKRLCLQGSSIVALSLAPIHAAQATSIPAPNPIDVNGQDFPAGFNNTQTVTGIDTAIRLRDSTIDQGFENSATGQITGQRQTGVEFGDGVILKGGFDNAGNIRGGLTGVKIGPNASISGGFTNTGTIEGGGIASGGGGGTGGSPITGDGTLVGGLGGAAGFGETVVPRNDDGSSQYDIQAVMENGLNFFGLTATKMWVNTNGNITFNDSLSEYTPEGITANTGTPLIAAFWADVDTRTPADLGANSAPIYVDVDAAKDIVTITWSGVNYYEQKGDKQNFFQMQLFDRGGGDFDIVYRYQNIQWTTGDASNGVGGLGGDVARAGFSAGDGVNFFELPQSGNQAQILDLENIIGNTGIKGLWAFQVRGGTVVEALRGTGVASEARNWTGRFFNAASGLIRGNSAGVNLKGTTFDGDFDNAGLITGGNSGIKTGVLMDYERIEGSFRNLAGGVISGGGTGASIRAGTFVGDAVNAGRISGGGNNTGWHIAAQSFSGSISNAQTGVLTALSKALHLQIGRLDAAITNSGLIEATATDGVAVQLDGFGNPPTGTYNGDFSNDGRIKGGSGANGKGVVINAAMPQGVFNFGVVETGGIAIDHTGPGNLTYTQDGANAVTRGDISFTAAGADKAVFKGGRFDGDIIGRGGNDVVESSTGATAFASGGATGLDAFSILGGTALLGTAAADTNGAGFDVTTAKATLNGTVYLDDDTSITADAVTIGPAAALNLFLTTDTSKHARITSAGAVDLKGTLRAFLDPISFGGTTQRRFVYEGIITAAGGLTGNFSSLSTGGNSLFTLEVEPATVLARSSAQSIGILATQSLNLVVSRSSLADFPELNTPNQRNLGAALEIIFTGGAFDSDLADLFDFILGLSPEDAAAVYDQVSGSTQAETPTTFVRSDEYFKDQIRARISAVRNLDGNCVVASVGDGGCFRRYAQGGPIITDTSDPFAWLRDGLRRSGSTSVWGRALGVWGGRDASIHAPGSDVTTGGLIAGVDHVFSETLMAGGAAQYTNTNVDFQNSRNEATVEGYQAGGYFSWGDSDFYLNGNASVLFNRFDTSRRFTVGPNSYSAKADYDATSLSAGFEAGTVVEADGANIQPYAGLSYVRQWVDGYRETGAGGLGLIVAEDEVDSLVSTLGVRAAFPTTIEGIKVTPELRAAWRHEFLDVRQSLDAAFIGAPNTVFAVRGTQSGRDTAVLGAGVTAPLADALVLYADYETQLNQTNDAHALTIGLRLTW